MRPKMHWTWWNVKTTPQRWAAYWLRRRGWIVFYLEPQARACLIGQPMGCWLKLYLDGEAHARRRT